MNRQLPPRAHSRGRGCSLGDWFACGTVFCICMFLGGIIYIVVTLEHPPNHQRSTQCHVTGVVVPLTRQVCGYTQWESGSLAKYCWSDRLLVWYNVSESAHLPPNTLSNQVLVHTNMSAGVGLLTQTYPKAQDALEYLRRRFVNKTIACWYDWEDPLHASFHRSMTKRNKLIIAGAISGLGLLSLLVVIACSCCSFRRSVPQENEENALL